MRDPFAAIPKSAKIRLCVSRGRPSISGSSTIEIVAPREEHSMASGSLSGASSNQSATARSIRCRREGDEIPSSRSTRRSSRFAISGPAIDRGSVIFRTGAVNTRRPRLISTFGMQILEYRPIGIGSKSIRFDITRTPFQRQRGTACARAGLFHPRQRQSPRPSLHPECR